MKKFKLFSRLSFIAAVTLLTSCAGDTTQKDTLTTTGEDTTAAVAKMDNTTKMATVSAPSTLMTVVHRVKDFAKWKVSYDEHDAMRLAAGLHSYVIARGVDDSNTILVAVKADDIAKAKAFSTDTTLKRAMKDGGVVGTPTIAMVTMQWMDGSDITTTLRSRSTYKVKDWEAWRKGFESNKQLRMDNGIVDRAYGHDVDDSHKVTVVVAITDPVKAKAFMSSEVIQQKMAESGVIGAPVRFMYNIVQKY